MCAGGGANSAAVQFRVPFMDLEGCDSALDFTVSKPEVTPVEKGWSGDPTKAEES